MRIILYPAVLILSIAFTAHGQSSGKVSYPYLGIEFTIPEGWVGQEVDGGYVVGHHSEPGFAFISTLEARSIDELKMLAQQGLTDDTGTHLQLTSTLEPVGSNAIGGQYQGTLQSSPVYAYMLGVVNANGGSVLVIAASSPQTYSDTHRRLAIQLGQSMVFSEAKSSPIAEQWRQNLQNAKLTYRKSYRSNSSPTYNSDSSPTGYTSSTGYNTKIEIHLCAQGHFKYKSNSSSSIDLGDGSASSKGAADGSGNWEVVSDHKGDGLLKLYFQGGEVYEYALTYQDNKVYLNGERYFVTYAHEGAEYAPECY